MSKLFAFLIIFISASTLGNYQIEKDDYSTLEVASFNEHMLNLVNEGKSYIVTYKPEGLEQHQITYDEEGNYKDEFQSENNFVKVEVKGESGTITFGGLDPVEAKHIDIENEFKTKSYVEENTKVALGILSEPDYIEISRSGTDYFFEASVESITISGKLKSDEGVLTFTYKDGDNAEEEYEMVEN